MATVANDSAATAAPTAKSMTLQLRTMGEDLQILQKDIHFQVLSSKVHMMDAERFIIKLDSILIKKKRIDPASEEFASLQEEVDTIKTVIEVQRNEFLLSISKLSELRSKITPTLNEFYSLASKFNAMGVEWEASQPSEEFSMLREEFDEFEKLRTAFLSAICKFDI